jgi:hypothetical protein
MYIAFPNGIKDKAITARLSVPNNPKTQSPEARGKSRGEKRKRCPDMCGLILCAIPCLLVSKISDKAISK